MVRIIDERSTGKTSRLMLIAKENNATFVCSNPRSMEYKAKAYGLDGIQFISYHEFVTSYNEGNYVIDEMENFVKSVMGENNLAGYSLSIDD